MCFKAFKYTDNIIVDIDPNTDPSLENVIADNDPNTDNNSISYAHNTDNNIVVADPHSEEVLAVVPGSVTLVLNFPASENKITVVPRMSYNNTGTMKIYILRDNNGKAGIYRWIRAEAGKSYIGSTGDLNERMANYFSINTTNSLIYRALLKYGHSAFRLDNLEYCDLSTLKEREQYYMDHLEHKYNILEFSHSLLGYKHTQEVSDKMKQKADNRIHKPNPGI